MPAVAENGFWLETYEAHGSSLLAFLKSRVGRRELAEDLLQETFVRAMRQGDRLRDGGRIRAYLFTTAYHLMLDHARHRTGKRTLLFSEMGPDGRDPAAERADEDARPPDSLAELSLFERQLRQALVSLPAAHRVAFEAAVLEQSSYAEVARRQGWSLEQVKTNVFRARRKLMAELRQSLCPAPPPDADRVESAAIGADDEKL